MKQFQVSFHMEYRLVTPRNMFALPYSYPVKVGPSRGRSVRNTVQSSVLVDDGLNNEPM